MEIPKKYQKFLPEKEFKEFPGFPAEPTNNYWRYPRIVNGWWHKLSGSEQKVLDYILRHTWGYDKDCDAISLTQFEEGIWSKKEHKWIDRGTGLARPTVIKSLRRLKKKGFIFVIRATRKGYINHYFPKIKGSEISEISLDEFLFQKFKGKCFYCGIKLIMAETDEGYSSEEAQKWFVIDHKFPKSRGGTDRIENLVASCNQCNLKKGKKSCEEFVDKLRKEKVDS